MQSDFRDWSDLRVFLAVVRAGSTLAASRTLGIAQPTVARRIDALEHALGLVLFERDTRGFQPTAEGLALVMDAEAMESAALALSDKAARLNAGRSHTIRITAFMDAFNNRLSAVLEEFTALHGDVRFALLPSNDVLDLAAGEADVAIRVANRISEPSLICRKIRSISMDVFASRAYAARHPVPQSEKDLPGHKVLVYGGRSAQQDASRWLMGHLDPAQICMTCDNVQAMEVAILMGAGIGLMPGGFDRNESVVRCFALPPETATSSWLLVSPAAYRRPEVKAFTAFFVPRYRAMFAKK